MKVSFYLMSVAPLALMIHPAYADDSEATTAAAAAAATPASKQTAYVEVNETKIPANGIVTARTINPRTISTSLRFDF